MSYIETKNQQNLVSRELKNPTPKPVDFKNLRDDSLFLSSILPNATINPSSYFLARHNRKKFNMDKRSTIYDESYDKSQGRLPSNQSLNAFIEPSTYTILGSNNRLASMDMISMSSKARPFVKNRKKLNLSLRDIYKSGDATDFQKTIMKSQYFNAKGK